MSVRRTALVLSVLLTLTACAEVGSLEVADEVTWPGEKMRTFEDTGIVYPRWLFNKPEHYEFSPAVSNFDPVNDHPMQWDGQDWDPSMWRAGDDPRTVLRRLYIVRFFTAQYGERGVPVVELGPRFWKASDLDRRRGLKLLADHTQVFAQGHARIVLRDWHTKKEVGVFTPKGMQLL
jgi:hypothetical protein